jgi:prepilin-type N-terminal cleavage/methylation domain-containing protein
MNHLLVPAPKGRVCRWKDAIPPGKPWNSSPGVVPNRHRMKPLRQRRCEAFTLIEIVVGLLIGGLVMVALYTLFFQYFGVTQKGEDYLTSVRDAMITLEDLRKELRAAREITLPKPLETTGSTNIVLADPSKELRLKGSNGEISYTVSKNSRNQMILEKAYWDDKKAVRRAEFHINRLNGFEVFWIKQKQTPGKSHFTTGSLFVTLELQGTVGTKSGTRVKIGTCMTPFFNTAENSTWP